MTLTQLHMKATSHAIFLLMLAAYFPLQAQSGFLSQDSKTSPLTLLSPGTHQGQNQLNFVLHPNYPNPVTGHLVIHYEIRESGHYVVSIVGSKGKEIKRLVDGFHHPGEFKMLGAASPRAHGVYMYKVENNAPSAQRRLLLLKY